MAKNVKRGRPDIIHHVIDIQVKVGGGGGGEGRVWPNHNMFKYWPTKLCRSSESRLAVEHLNRAYWMMNCFRTC